MPNARITADPSVMMGKARIKGTRITVEFVLRKLAGPHSIVDIFDAYPSLSEGYVRAALAFAADYLQHETVLAAEGCAFWRTRTFPASSSNDWETPD